MKKVSNKFRNSLRGVRQLGAIIGYYSSDGHYVIATENNRDVLTEDELQLITQAGTVDYDSGTINSVNVLFNASLFKTTCKTVQIDCVNKIEVGTKINVRIGVYIQDNNEYEYVNYGDYYIIEEPVYQANTKSYLITGYDKMVQSMINYDDDPLNITYPITHRGFVTAICRKLGWEEELGKYPNYDKLITGELYLEQGLTYRDILDDLNSACSGSFMFSTDNQLIYKKPTETGLIVEDEDLKDTNVDFGAKYGKINSLIITTNDNILLNSREDIESIEENGKTELNIKDNYLLNAQNNDFIDNLFNELDGLEYYLYDIDSTGLLILEPLDIFTFRHDGIDYKTILFNDDIKLSQGLEESLYTEEPQQNEQEYVATDKEEKKINDAFIKINKAEAEIGLKVSKGDVINEINLDESGTSINAQKISLEGYTTINDGFSVDLEGNATMNNATISGNITATSGQIAGYTIDGDTLYGSQVGMDAASGGHYAFWAGASVDNTVNAPFRVSHTGELRATNATIEGTISSSIINGPTINGGSINLVQNENITIPFKVTQISSGVTYENTTGSAGTTLKRAGVTYLNFNSQGNGGNLYVRNSNGDPVIHLQGSNGVVYCTNVSPSSLEKNKKNIKLINNCLNIIDDIDIYKYNYKFEADTDKKHIGFVIGDNYNYSSEITSIDENGKEIGVDLYSMTSVCLQAIKEQQEIIKSLEKRIEKLEGGK